MTSKQEKIKNHQKIKLTGINVVRRLGLSEEQAGDEGVMRRFCARMGKTLPGMLEIDVKPAAENDKVYQWHVTIYEQPKEKEKEEATA